MRVDIGDGVRLFVDVVGSGLRPDDDAMVPKPTLIVLHGGPGSDHSSFRPYMDRFADTHQVLLVDHRGNGRSDGWDDPASWNLDTWADDVVRLCDVLGIERPVVLGLSFGGFVAIRYAARHPDHPAAIVLASTKARTHEDESAARFHALGGERAEATYRRIYTDRDLAPDAWVDYVTVNMPLYNPTPSPFGPGRSIMNLELLVDFTGGEHVDMDLRDDVRRIAVPTLLLAGSEDPMTPPSCSEEILERLAPGLGTMAIVAGAGHGTFRDRPEESEAILRDFLAEEQVIARQA
ncbi:alpha/beta fold hydrolase [Dermatobacter hominis]|uniref:alpha/beta fold hydrolase n=1 Tax=Dermatobacter hominis TaxID=2884263 RepID=UPI001D12ED54|nr:alpha/beta fold hydrolase [Dermatobacter hominis]UDY37828.1 alpha/beta hydrolase [Dermatobacter hominis]